MGFPLVHFKMLTAARLDKDAGLSECLGIGLPSSPKGSSFDEITAPVEIGLRFGNQEQVAHNFVFCLSLGRK